MSLVTDYHREHVARRMRMTIAARGIVDDGIDLKRKRKTPRPTAIAAPLQLPAPLPDNVIDLALMRLVKAAANIEGMVRDATDRDDKPIPIGPPIRTIQRAVSKFYGITLKDLVSEGRTAKFNLPRHVGMYLAKTLTLQSFAAIGRQFRRDHTTVIHGYRKIKSQVATDDRLRDEIQLIIMRIMEKTEATA